MLHSYITVHCTLSYAVFDPHQMDKQRELGAVVASTVT